MGSLRRFIVRHVGITLAMLLCSVLAGLLALRTPRLRVALPEHEAHIVEFSPDSRVLLTDGASGGCIRDAATGHVLVPLMRAGTNGPSRATRITWPRFTADGRRVIVELGGPRFGSPNAGLERTVTLAVFDVATGRERASFVGVGSGIWHGSALPPAEYALSADGSTLAFCRVTGFGPERTGQVTVWDIDAEKVVAEFPGLTPLALSPDGSTVAHGDNDDARARRTFPTIRALVSGRSARTRPGGLRAPTGLGAGPVAFSPDGKLLAARVLGQREVFDVEIRDVASDQVRAVLSPNQTGGRGWISPEDVWFGADARMLLLEDIGGYTSPQRIQCWDLSGASPRLMHQGRPESVAPGGSKAVDVIRSVVSHWVPAPREDGAVEILHLTGERARHRVTETGVQSATISADGRIMAALSNRVEVTGWPWPGTLLARILGAVGLGPGPPRRVLVDEIAFRDAESGQLIGMAHRPAVVRLPGSMTFSPDGKTLVLKDLPVGFSWNSGNPMIDWSVGLWDVPTGRWTDGISAPAAGLASALLLAGAGFDRWRSRRRSSATALAS